MRHTGRRDAGFTLVEVMLSLFLLSIAVMTLMSMFTYAGRSILMGKKRTEATYIGQVMLERLTNDTLEHVALFSGVDTRVPSTFPAEGTPEHTATDDWKSVMGARLHSGSYGTVTVENSQPVEGLTRITVTVIWPITTGRTSNVQLFLVRRS